MSLPRDSQEQIEIEDESPLNMDVLESIFSGFEKQKESLAIGVEHERFLVDPGTLKPARWFGTKGVSAVMSQLLAQNQLFDKNTFSVLENNEIIGILLKDSSITVEPGGQLELSGAPLKSIFDIDKELSDFEGMVKNILADLGLASLKVGFHPVAKREDFEWVPKSRYGIMRKYMPKKGNRGHDMMLRTCTVQANFDYLCETDMIASFRTALLVSPIITSLFATSPFLEGNITGYLSERSVVWHDTDSDRCGFPMEVFDSDFSYRKWIERALDTPMYFIRRNGLYHDATSITFREYMNKGFSGMKARKKDFYDHLTTIFTDARIKPQLEVRSADCGPGPMLRALPALWKGILYDEASREKTLRLLSDISPKDLTKHQLEAAKHGLDGKIGEKKIIDYAMQIVEISKSGLLNQHKNPKGPDETLFLAPLEQILENGKNLAQLMIQKQNSSTKQDFKWMIEEG